jgi:hypothetical protein
MSSVDPRRPSPIPSTLIVGGGPGGLGPLLWAAQKGCLEQWLDRGVLVVERSGRLGGSLGGYGINSDSLGGSYLECLDAGDVPSALQDLRHDPVTEEMRRHRETFPPLPLVDRYMGRIGQAIAAMMSGRRGSGLHLSTTVESLRLRKDGTVAVRVRRGVIGKTLLAHSAVVAVGGRQLDGDQELAAGLKITDCRARHVMPSDRLLSHDGLVEADRIIRNADGRRIVILGGSHSAYAAAWALLERAGASALVDGQIAIVQRRPPRVFYPDRAAADADGYAVAPGDICSRTGRVNRMGGLRGHGRDVWRRIARRPDVVAEHRIAIHPLNDFSPARLRAEIDEAALVVPCLGYRSATVPIFGPSGERLPLAADDNRVAVSASCRLLCADGIELPQIFGVGLGTGFRPDEAMGCEPNFDGQANSLWLYQNDIGGLIYRGIHAAIEPASIASAAE